MKKVTKEEFYETFKSLDVVVKVLNPHYPYTTVFTLRYGDEVGRCVDIGNGESEYYLQEQSNEDL